MSRFAPKTLRRMPPAAREIARLANDLASVQTRLANRIDGLVSMEMMARASERVFCNNAAHADVVKAALRYVRAIDDPVLGPGARTDALMALQAAVEPFDPDNLDALHRGGDGAASIYRDSRPRSHSTGRGMAAPLHQ